MADARNNILKRLFWDLPGTMLKAGAKDTATGLKGAGIGIAAAGVGLHEGAHATVNLAENAVNNRWGIARWVGSKGLKVAKWGGIATGLAAGGGLLYAALRPSGRSSAGEEMQDFQQRIAENDAKLQALQSMTPPALQPSVMQAPMMLSATPQGVQAQPYPTTLLVPANSSQYQGLVTQGPAQVAQLGA